MAWANPEAEILYLDKAIIMAKSLNEIKDDLKRLKEQRTAVAGTSNNGPGSGPQPRHNTAGGRPRSASPQLTGKALNIHRMPPHSVEAEQGVLGSMLIDARNAIPEARRKIDANFFYLPAHQTIFQRLCEMHAKGDAVDLVTFTNYLRDVGQLDPLGGPAFVTSLFTFVPTAANIAHYIDIIRDKHIARQLVRLGIETVRQAYEEQDDIGEAVRSAQCGLQAIRLVGRGELDDVENFAFRDLLAFKATEDPNVLIGNRWGCRGFTCLWAGGAGYGKSSLEMQLAIYWACGEPVWGMRPARALKSLIIQAENDLGDTGEQLQGVMRGIAEVGDIEVVSKRRRELIEANMVIVRVFGVSGNRFLSLLSSLIELHKPDLVWIDPLFAFAGCDLVDAKAVGLFLREGIIAAAVRHGVCIHVIHHVGKPDRDNDAKKNWSELDFQYLGFGSSEIQNSFRGVNVLLPVSGQEGIFRLILSKRGVRAGAKTPNGEPTTSVYLTYSKEGICWLQIDKPEPVTRIRGQGKDTQFQTRFSDDHVLSEMSLTHSWKTAMLQKHMKAETGMSEKTFYRIWAELKAKQRIHVNSDGEWLRRSPFSVEGENK
jgi:hypothetical protein